MKAPPLDVEAAGRVAVQVELQDVQLLSLSAGHIAPTEPPDGALAWDIPITTAVWFKEPGGKVFAGFPFVVNIDVRPDASSAAAAAQAASVRIVELAVTWRLVYAFKPGADVSDDDLDNFVGINGYLHAWPYLRAEVQSLTTKLGLPSLLLPVQLAAAAKHRVTVARLCEFPGATAPAATPPALPSGDTTEPADRP